MTQRLHAINRKRKPLFLKNILSDGIFESERNHGCLYDIIHK